VGACFLERIVDSPLPLTPRQVESYLELLMRSDSVREVAPQSPTSMNSSAFTETAAALSPELRTLSATFYVQQIMQMSEDTLALSWARAAAGSRGQGTAARLRNALW